MPFEPIAIIGMSCIMPGSLSPEALWLNSINNKNCLSQSQFLAKALAINGSRKNNCLWF